MRLVLGLVVTVCGIAIASAASAIQVASNIYVDLLTSEDFGGHHSTAEFQGATDLSGWNPFMDVNLQLS